MVIGGLHVFLELKEVEMNFLQQSGTARSFYYFHPASVLMSSDDILTKDLRPTLLTSSRK